MRKKGRVEIEMFMILITVVLTSAVILLLVKSGTIKVKDEIVAEPILNAEFLPAGKDGFLAVKEVNFCSYVDENLNCVSEQQKFNPTDNVYVRFVVQSSTLDNQAILVRNYRIRNPLGEVVLEADQKNTYNFDLTSSKNAEDIVFADFFVMGVDAVQGEYILDVIVENSLLDKTVTVSKKFMIEG